MIYWLIFLGIIVLNLRAKKSSSTYLWAGFYMFILAAVVNLFGILIVSEFLFRVCLILFLAGIIFSIINYLIDESSEEQHL